MLAEAFQRARSLARPLVGASVRRLRREAQWRDPRLDFRVRRADGSLAFVVSEHATHLTRPLLGLDPELQANKVVNLRIAAALLDGLVLRSGQRLSFWREVGRPSYARGFLDGPPRAPTASPATTRRACPA